MTTKRSEFDKSLIAKDRERKEAAFLYSIEKDPSPAVVFDTDLVNRAKDRSDTSHLKTTEVRFQKLSATSSLKKNWAATQRDKQNRITRDLQFELAVNTLHHYKKKSSNIIHRDELKEGIEALELTLFKNGIGILFAYSLVFI
jgi:hypothetical protein